MFHFDEGFFIPIMIFSIPIIAVTGGIVIGIVRSLGRQRMAELAAQERIAAIQRGVDVSKLPPLSVALDDDAGIMSLTPAERDKRRSQGLMIAGIITLAVGFGLTSFLSVVQRGESVWAVGIIPMTVGAALLLSAWLVRPRG